VDQEAAALTFPTLPSLAAKYQLSVYDAVYLELAHRRKLPLGRKDGPLRKAAVRCGVGVWD
jgi:predicted nucleic acid-binding protein